MILCYIVYTIVYTAAWSTGHCPLVACLGWVDNETSDTPLHAAAVIRMGGYYIQPHVVGEGKL